MWDGFYVYDADGARVRKTNADGTFTEYVDFGGQPVAEKGQNGNWTDYIFANGKRIAKVEDTDLHVHLSGRGGSVQWNLPINNVPLINEAMLSWRERHDGGATSFMQVQFADNTWANFNWATMNGSQGPDDVWEPVHIDLSAFAGKAIWGMWFWEVQGAGSGAWNAYVGDMAVSPGDGSVVPIYNRQQSVPGVMSWSNAANAQLSIERSASTLDTGSAMATTSFYLSDHLGTAQMEFSAGGWPVYHGQFAPYGQELQANGSLLPTDAQDGSSNHYKFTGKERDAETGNDYFGARYYASSSGRWLSPDWSAKEEPIPYAKLDDPQSLNLYGYMYNNPLIGVDADGHWPSWNAVKTTLDVVGFVPVVGDVANAASGAISLAQGHYGEAALSFAAAIPGVGLLGEVGKGAELLKDVGVLANRSKGLAAEAKSATEIIEEGGKILGSHVGIQTEKGLRVSDNLVEKGGKIINDETKAGGAVRNAKQIAKDESMASEGGKIVGKNAPPELRGQTVKIETNVRKQP